jgi:hypothetical protein
MLTEAASEWYTYARCLEGFFFGKISVPCQCALTTLAKKVQSFLGLGIYSGIFAVYLQCPLKVSGTSIFVFYVLCLLYVLSMASIASDLLGSILVVVKVSNNSICKIIIMQMRIGALLPQLQNYSQPMLFHVQIVSIVASGFCDFIAQCILVRINHRHGAYHPFYSPSKYSKIFRCWIVWGKDIRVVIVIPSFLAIAYIGQ